MVNIYKPKLTLLQQDILRWLFINSGNSLNIRNISKCLGVSAPAVAKSIPLLEKEGFVLALQDKESKRWSIGLNGNNHKVIQLKRVENLKIIYESGLADLLERELAGATIILFGSYSRGDDTVNSDIDIAVIERKSKRLNLENFDKELKRKINLNFYDSWKDVHKHLKGNILNGIVLSGSINL